MLYVSSRGRTEIDLKRYFSFNDKASTFKNLVQINAELVKTNIFTNTNLLCVSNSVNLNDKHVQLLNNIGCVMQYDYNNVGKYTDMINGIAKKVTNNMISNVITQDMLKFPTNVALINVIYFYSKWKSPFDPQMTKIEDFYSSSTTQVTMMTQTFTKFNYFEDKNNQILEMDYIDGYFTMGFILPKILQNNPITNNDQLKYYISQLSQIEITTLKIPKFTHEFKYKIDNVFRENGLDGIFHNLEIDLFQDPVKLSYIIHGAVIIVDESGTKAAAHTTMVMSFGCTLSQNNKTINFIANHPFLYYIRYKPKNVITFLGQYY